MRSKVASALFFAFSEMPDKQQAWNDLIRLTCDEKIGVKAYANYSLGKISIFQASRAEKEEDYKKSWKKQLNFLKSQYKNHLDGIIHLDFVFHYIALFIP